MDKVQVGPLVRLLIRIIPVRPRVNLHHSAWDCKSKNLNHVQFYLVIWDKYGITDVDGNGVCVVCNKEIPSEFLKPNKLDRHLQTHPLYARLDADGKVRVFRKKGTNYCERKRSYHNPSASMTGSGFSVMKLLSLLARNKRVHIEGESVIKPC